MLHTTVWSRKVKHTVVGNLEPQSLLAGLEVAVQSFAICAMCASVPGSLGRTEESEGQIGFYYSEGPFHDTVLLISLKVYKKTNYLLQ